MFKFFRNLFDIVSLRTTNSKWMRRNGFSFSPNRNGVNILSDICALVLFIANGAQTIKLLKSLDDVDGLMECFSTLSFCVMGSLKHMSLRCYRETIFSLIDQLDPVYCHCNSRSIVCEVHLKTNVGNRGILQKDNEELRAHTKQVGQISIGLPTLYVLTGIIFVISPFVEYFLSFIMEINKELPHILPIWLPIKDNFVTYPLLISMELIASIFCVITHINFDVASLGMMVLISGKMKKLCNDVTDLAGSGKHLTISKEVNNSAHSKIISYHKQHLKLMKITRTLNNILSPIMGVYLDIVTVALCGTALQLTKKMSIVQLLSLFQYMCGNLAQLFLYCCFGDKVVQASDVGQAEAIYGSAWWSLNPKVRRELLILGYGFSKPLSLQAGWFHSLNLPSFLKILQTAYSFYAVLSKANNPNK